TALELPVAGLHIDAVRAGGRFDALVQAWPAGGGREGKVLSLGVIDGRNIWKADLSAVLRQLDDAQERAGAAQLWVAPSCSLAHDMRRTSPHAARRKKQLRLPLFPTTTIGSFPQTAEVRNARKKLHDGKLTPAEYNAFIAEEITRTLKLQEELGLDVLVHGEFERNDMVEYFGEQLEGFAFTEHGWVQSYGSRYVKPPIIYGDVSRPKAMTVRWSTFAQS